MSHVKCQMKNQMSNVPYQMSVDHVRSYEISVDLVRSQQNADLVKSQHILWDPSIKIRVCRLGWRIDYILMFSIFFFLAPN